MIVLSPQAGEHHFQLLIKYTCRESRQQINKWQRFGQRPETTQSRHVNNPTATLASLLGIPTLPSLHSFTPKAHITSPALFSLSRNIATFPPVDQPSLTLLSYEHAPLKPSVLFLSLFPSPVSLPSPCCCHLPCRSIPSAVLSKAILCPPL